MQQYIEQGSTNHCQQSLMHLALEPYISFKQASATSWKPWWQCLLICWLLHVQHLTKRLDALDQTDASNDEMLNDVRPQMQELKSQLLQLQV